MRKKRFSTWTLLLGIAAVFPACFGKTAAADSATASAATEEWKQVAVVSQSVLDKGLTGGEGCQWPQSIAIDQENGELLFYGTDVGGIFRSTNGGKTWMPCNTGMNTRGNCGFAIDPKNSSRVLAVAGNSLEMDMHGLYLSTDKGETWRSVLPKSNLGYRDFREQVAFDPSSYNKNLGYSRIAYWSSQTSAKEKGMLFKTENGGKNWEPVNEEGGDSILKLHPEKGYVYLANQNGFFKSVNGGKTFRQVLKKRLTGLDVVFSRPDHVYVCENGGIYLSEDSGETFRKINMQKAPPLTDLGKNEWNEGYGQLRVSPANPDHMVIMNGEGPWSWQRYYSRDGGVNWRQAAMDNALASVPYNIRQAMFAWHPKDPETVWSFGGDWITRSTDGGAVWKWDNNGNSGMMLGGGFSFNTRHPELIFLPSQDYAAVFSRDTGRTWEYCDVQGYEWGGWCYGGCAVSPEILVTGAKYENAMRLAISRDGGRSFTDTGIPLSGKAVAFAHPVDSAVIFCHNQRSTDQGMNWKEMTGCKGVFLANPQNPEELFGATARDAVVSLDRGETWKTVASFPGEVCDLALDPHARRLFVIAGSGDYSRFYAVDLATGNMEDRTDTLPTDQYYARRLVTVAVDPVDPQVVYAGYCANVYMSDISVVRSTDGGNTWGVLNRGHKQSVIQSGLEGPREVGFIRVHPITRELFAGTGCFGTWKIGPPAAATVQPAAEQTGESVLVPDEKKPGLPWLSIAGGAAALCGLVLLFVYRRRRAVS